VPIRSPIPSPVTNEPVSVSALPLSLADFAGMIGIMPSSEIPQPSIVRSAVGGPANSLTRKWRNEPDAAMVSGSNAA